MIRRPLLILGALGAAAVLTSCSTFESGVAARVDGRTIDDRVLRVLLASPEDAGAGDTGNGDAGNGDAGAGSALNGTDARSALGSLIESVVATRVATDFGIDLTEVRAASLAQIEGSLTGQRRDAWEGLSDSEKALVADYSAALQALSAFRGPVPADLEARYANPESTGFFCLRYMAFTAHETAKAAAERLVAGEDFAAVANSVDANSNGGAVTTEEGSQCVRLDQFRSPGIPTELVRALFDATPGAFVGPVRASYDLGDQWFILLHRPYDEIADDLAAAVGAAPAFAEYLATLSVTPASVASRYGVWDPQNAAVVAQP